MRFLNKSTEPRTKLAPAGERSIHAFEIDDRTFVFDSNSLQLVEVESDLERDTILASGTSLKPVFPYYCNTRVRYLVLEACHACNFDCSYCMLQQYAPGAAVMSVERAKQAITHFFPDREVLQKDQRSQIGFFGGEPLCNWDMIREIVSFFEGMCAPRQPRFHVTTNGSLITRDKAKFMAAHNFTFIVSLDGPEHIHDQCRKYKGGTGTFQAVIAGLKILKDFGLSRNVTLRATFTPENADTQLERVEFLNELKYKGYANWVSVEPAFLAESLCADEVVAGKEGISAPDIAKLGPAYREVAEWYVNEIREGRKPVLHFFHSFLRRLLYCLPYGTECGSGCGYISANGKGEIFACHREQSSRIGHLDEGGIDEELRAKWIDNRIYLRKHCMSCEIRYVCGGGCRERSVGENGDIREPTFAECALKEILFNTVVWILAELGPEKLSKLIPPPVVPPAGCR